MISRAAIVALIAVLAGSCQTVTGTNCTRPLDVDRMRQLLATGNSMSPAELRKIWTHDAPMDVTRSAVGGQEYVQLQFPTNQGEQCLCCDVFTLEGSPSGHLLSAIMIRQIASRLEAATVADAAWSELTNKSIRLRLNEDALSKNGALFETQESISSDKGPVLDLSIENVDGSYIIRIRFIQTPES